MPTHVTHRLRHVPLNTLAPAPTPSKAHTFSDVSAKLMTSSDVSGDADEYVSGGDSDGSDDVDGGW